MARKTGELPGKAGVTSTAKKLDNSRHGFDEHPASRKTAGAFGHEEKVLDRTADEADEANREPERDEER